MRNLPIVLILALVYSCSDGPEVLSPYDIQLDVLEGQWYVDSVFYYEGRQPNGVHVPSLGAIPTPDWHLFSLEFKKDLSFKTSDSPDTDVWPVEGSYYVDYEVHYIPLIKRHDGVSIEYGLKPFPEGERKLYLNFCYGIDNHSAKFYMHE